MNIQFLVTPNSLIQFGGGFKVRSSLSRHTCPAWVVPVVPALCQLNWIPVATSRLLSRLLGQLGCQKPNEQKRQGFLPGSRDAHVSFRFLLLEAHGIAQHRGNPVICAASVASPSRTYTSDVVIVIILIIITIIIIIIIVIIIIILVHHRMSTLFSAVCRTKAESIAAGEGMATCSLRVDSHSALYIFGMDKFQDDAKFDWSALVLDAPPNCLSSSIILWRSNLFVDSTVHEISRSIHLKIILFRLLCA